MTPSHYLSHACVAYKNPVGLEECTPPSALSIIYANHETWNASVRNEKSHNAEDPCTAVSLIATKSALLINDRQPTFTPPRTPPRQNAHPTIEYNRHHQPARMYVSPAKDRYTTTGVRSRGRGGAQNAQQPVGVHSDIPPRTSNKILETDGIPPLASGGFIIASHASA